jgi:hypothetical protein
MILSGLAILTLVGVITLSGRADEVVFPSRPIAMKQQRCHFQVLFRQCDWHPWVSYSTHHNYTKAHRTANLLKCQGFKARVVQS